MTGPTLPVPVVVEPQDEPKVPKEDYAAPRLFAVGATVDLLQGNTSDGFKDGWYDQPRHYE